MRAEEQFDSFYLKTRRALVHQTFALTGDLAAAQRAVRDAYVAAWHHWRKVKNHEDPRDWVRPRAWALAQRRHTARLWQRTRELSVEDRALLNALHKLPVSERRALIIIELAGLPAELGARELNVTQETLERQLASARRNLSAAVGTEPSAIPGLLGTLDEVVSKSAVPRAAAIRRQGRTRRRTHTLAAAAAVTFLAVGSGAFAHQPATEAESGSPATSPDQPRTTDRGKPAPESTLPSADDLLDAKDAARLDPAASWRVMGTNDNTSGDGINYVCQQERFADPDGVGTLVRTIEANGEPKRSLVQAVEISGSEDAAATTYAKVLSWFASCSGGNLNLERTYSVTGVADRAALFELQAWAPPQASYSVALAQVGQVVTTSVVRTRSGSAPQTPRVAGTLARAATKLCEQAGGTDCGGRPGTKLTPPPPSGETPGVLATVDMPPVDGVAKPWVGTNVTNTPARNPAATTCDHAEFRKEGAVTNRTRSFLVPEGRLPARFGLTETYGKFPSPKAASEFLRSMRGRVANCEDRNLAIKVLSSQDVKQGELDGTTWRLRAELSQDTQVYVALGFVRRGATVAQLSFLPSGQADLSSSEFRALLVRAGQRLGELE